MLRETASNPVRVAPVARSPPSPEYCISLPHRHTAGLLSWGIINGTNRIARRQRCPAALIAPGDQLECRPADADKRIKKDGGMTDAEIAELSRTNERLVTEIARRDRIEQELRVMSRTRAFSWGCRRPQGT